MIIASVGQPSTHSLHPVHSSRRILALRFTSTSIIGLASGVSYNSMASSSHTIVHWSQPMHCSCLTHATAAYPPLIIASSSALIESSIIRMRFCSAARRASRSGISVTLGTQRPTFSMYASLHHLDAMPYGTRFVVATNLNLR